MIYLKYFWYVLRHKYYVFIECRKEGILWRGITHDLSKFLPDEFISYAKYFYSDYSKLDEYDKLSLLKAFNKAWLKHIHRNPHHWQYWILHFDDGGYEAIYMYGDYTKEMLCDWIGAGKSIKGGLPVLEWYKRNKFNQIIHRLSREWIERSLYGGRG
ncbi:DUF5662 family protein [Candidatus Pacearchaeota archaeon]|jgi:hypothetical protein|nr:DUF5662 family protein [Candidatus Pacearchaeota archaeon]